MLSEVAANASFKVWFDLTEARIHDLPQLETSMLTTIIQQMRSYKFYAINLPTISLHKHVCIVQIQ